MMGKREARRLPSLRRYLLLWFVGGAAVMVFAYTQLLEYYLEIGIDLRTVSVLERTAEEYAQARNAPGDRPALPLGPNLVGYADLGKLPPFVGSAFDLDDLEPGEVLQFRNLDFNFRDEKQFSIDTGDFCAEGICEMLFLYPYQLSADEGLYLVHGVVGSEEIYEQFEFTDQFAVAVGVLLAGLMLLVAFLIIRNIAAPVRRLNAWSAAQSVEHVDTELPNLRFRELYKLAARIQYAFERMREGVRKEQLFLRHASHELRTPIAILANNVELIDRLSERPDRSEAEQAAFERQYRALEDVQLLMETLLWVNRQSDNLPKSEPVGLRAEVDDIVAQYRYLIDARSVALEVDGDGSLDAPVAAVRIVLSNLVRNAFQYTVEGEVRIRVEAAAVVVENASSASMEAEPDEEYGFGFGLELVALICERFAWHWASEERPQGRHTMVRFEDGPGAR